ncbi:MAG: winged helix-turn-helix transcriptional regulator [Candidatus Thermoplasmatota archaeon]|jgi:predicted transcriptional regulator|nr:winged helix-turn-helix transcriptional regulator [Candidatus Thermoplasmatota archaeon]
MKQISRKNVIQERTKSVSGFPRIHFNSNRRAIFNCILENPGVHYSKIRRETGLAAGVITHHVRELERKRLIQSHCGKYLKRFYPFGMTISCEPLSARQSEVVEVISRRTFSSTREIAEELGKTRQAVIYHLKNLATLGVIRSKMKKKRRFWYTMKK